MVYTRNKLGSIAVLILLVCFSLTALGAIDDTEKYKKSSLNEYVVSEEDWKGVKGKIDYSDEREPPPPKEKPDLDVDLPDPDIDVPNFGIGPAMQVLMYLLIIGILAYVIYRVAFSGSFSSSKKIKKTKVITLENLEEYIHETELERFLREALEDDNLKQALRVQYLMILKQISENGWIKWKREKTNGEYLQEMFARPEFDEFRQLTLIFERVWYGTYDLTNSEYQNLSPRFKSYLQKVTNG